MGAAHGMRMRKRTKDFPANFFISARARILPITMTASCETKVKMKVLRRARRKTVFVTTLWKFCSPTNETSRLPAEELVTLSPRARRKGTPTRRRI